MNGRLARLPSASEPKPTTNNKRLEASNITSPFALWRSNGCASFTVVGKIANPTVRRSTWLAWPNGESPWWPHWLKLRKCRENRQAPCLTNPSRRVEGWLKIWSRSVYTGWLLLREHRQFRVSSTVLRIRSQGALDRSLFSKKRLTFHKMTS